jgi:hypothetical protein
MVEMFQCPDEKAKTFLDKVLCPIKSVKLLIIKGLWKFLEIIHFTGEFRGAKPPDAEKWVF